MTAAQQQAIIRSLSPQYLAENPPVGIVENLAAITERFAPKKFVEFRKPFCRKPDELDEKRECPECHGDGDAWLWELQDYGDCPYCPDSSGKLPFRDNEVFLTVWRDSHSIETLAFVLDNGEVNAMVSCSQPGFPYGKEVLLSEEEKALARSFVKQEADVNTEKPNTTEEPLTEIQPKTKGQTLYANGLP